MQDVQEDAHSNLIEAAGLVVPVVDEASDGSAFEVGVRREDIRDLLESSAQLG